MWECKPDLYYSCDWLKAAVNTYKFMHKNMYQSIIVTEE